MLGAGLAAAGAGVVTNLIGAGVAARNTDKTIKASKQLAEYAYQKDLEQWHRNNQYNSPVAQMRRLEEANLNPHLVYGNGAVGNASGASPQFKPPNVEYNYKNPLDLSQAINMYQDFQIKDAQVSNYQAQNDFIRARTMHEDLRQLYTLENINYRRQAGDLQEQSYRHKEELRGVKKAIYETQFDALRTKLRGLEVDNELKRRELNLRQEGVTFSDNPLLRIFIQQLHNSGSRRQSNYERSMQRANSSFFNR